MKSIDVLLSIDEVLSRAEEGDMVELVAANVKRFAGFYYGKKEIEPLDDEPTIGHQPGKEQVFLAMAHPFGVDQNLDDLPEIYMSRHTFGGIGLKEGGYKIGDFTITQGRFLEERKFCKTDVNALADMMAQYKDGVRHWINTLLRLTFSGEKNQVIGYVTATDASFIHLLSPSTDSRDYSIYIDDFGEGPMFYSPVMDCLSWGTEENQTKMMPTAITKVPVLKIEYYAE